MKKTLPVILLWVTAVVGIVLVNISFFSYSTVFLGVAESNEFEINYSSPVEIRSVHIAPGQEVKEGDLLISVESPELDAKIEAVTSQLAEIKARVNVSVQQAVGQIEEVEHLMATRSLEINSQIAQYEAQLQLNKDLTKDLKSIDANEASFEEQNPIKVKIEALKEELRIFKVNSQARISQLNTSLSSNQNPYDVQAKNLVNELGLLSTEKQELTSYSPVSGIIGGINFKQGEKVSPFTPIFSIYSKSPSYVQGYIHENTTDNVSVGDSLVVTNNQKSIVVKGVVLGVSSRIVEFPLRLRKNPEIGIWGREVQIGIPQGNDFLLGEKVTVKLDK